MWLIFDDCLALPDGRLKQLVTFIVQIDFISCCMSLMSYSMDDLPNLKGLSLVCYDKTFFYDNLIVPLLRRPSQLEELIFVCLYFKPAYVNDYSCSIVKYPHLISLDIIFVNVDYVDQFLNESKTHLPRLTELKVQFHALKEVTKTFTQDATRLNCATVKRLIVEDSIVFSEDVYRYFPSL
ncbi:unnamed protein product [Rotaria socialis]|uniref:Uncharacterized protein n=1 Tax=Rotaria socialis TaxID=392032 RepID=A0A820V2K9_9BILA|nr:unnamed protein product [Rotaria socialis]